AARGWTRGRRPRSEPRPVTPVQDLVDRGATAVVGDLSEIGQTRAIARDVNRLGRMDAVIHNVGVYTGTQVMPVNIVAPCFARRRATGPRSSRANITGLERRGGGYGLTGVRQRTSCADWLSTSDGACPAHHDPYRRASGAALTP